MTTKAANGNGDLPPAREAIIDQAQRIHQEVAHERDMLLREVAGLKSDIAGYKVSVEAYTTQMSEMESRVSSAMLTRDQALAERIKYEALFVSVQAQLRAFNVPAAPLIKDAENTSQ